MADKNKASKVLLSFVGNRDPYNESSAEDPGPVLSLLLEKPFDEVVLFCTSAEYLERAKTLEKVVQENGLGLRFNIHTVNFHSVVDYEEIYCKLLEVLRPFQFSTNSTSPGCSDVSVLLDPGTPQIQTCWFLLVRSGELPATLLQGVPPRFAGGSYRVREIHLENSCLPRVLPIASALSKKFSGKVVAPLHTGARLRVSDRCELYDFGDLVILGESQKFRNTLDQARAVARYGDVSALIQGETGTGKEIISQLIHTLSPRKDRPFVAINCAALSPHLVESEFFGHLRGAFTGADRDRIGKFRAAEGGTVFLDEIGDLPLEIQPKLLRALQEKKVQPVGSDKELPVNVRVLAATNRELPAMLESRTFRRDLYDRLNQVTIPLPPLRERDQDIQILAGFFLEQWNNCYKETKEFTKEVLDALYRYSWPGNVRELHNTIIALCASARGDTLTVELLPPTVRESNFAPFRNDHPPLWIPEDGMNLRAFLHQVERRFYELALRRAGGKREKAASLLGINAPAFRKALKERFPDLEET